MINLLYNHIFKCVAKGIFLKISNKIEIPSLKVFILMLNEGLLHHNYNRKSVYGMAIFWVTENDHFTI